MVFRSALMHYKDNFPIALSFAILLVFVVVFDLLSNTFISSGSIFWEYNFSLLHIFDYLVSILTILLFLLAFSFFSSVIIFNTKESIHFFELKEKTREKIKSFTIKIYVYYLFLVLILVGLSYLLYTLFVPFWIITIIAGIISVSLFFVPQSIIIDEDSLRRSISHNFHFIRTHFSYLLIVFVIALVLVFIVGLIEFALNSYSYLGKYVGLFLNLVIVIPLIEIFKTQFYLRKHDLAKPFLK
ncbi:MAG: hypothetical protein ABH821_05670 [archaeon]